MALNEGQILANKYRIEKLLGEGGMGSVYVAVNQVLQKRVALKVMSARFAAMPAAVERFQREAIAASRVSHASIVQVFDAGEHEGAPWIAMEMLAGESLGERLERGPMSVEEVLRMGEGVLSALAEVHEEGIVHRDLKPDNIFLASSRNGEWTPKVLDFGVAKDTSEGALNKLTATGAVVGTAYYLSPEQAKGLSDIDARADVYAMGVVLFECLSGDMPYEAETITQLIAKMFTEPPRHLHEVAPHIPGAIADVVTTCLAQDRAQRFQTTRALLEALRAAAAAGPGAGARGGFAATALAPARPASASQGGQHPSSPQHPSSGVRVDAAAATGIGHPAGPSGYGAPAPSYGGHGSSPGSGGFPMTAAGTPAHAAHGDPAHAGRHLATAVLPAHSLPGASLSGSLAGGSMVGPPQRSRAGLFALVLALFLLGAAGTGGAVYMAVGGDDGTRVGTAVATAAAPAADVDAVPSPADVADPAATDLALVASALGAEIPGSEIPAAGLVPEPAEVDPAADDTGDLGDEDEANEAEGPETRRAARRRRAAANEPDRATAAPRTAAPQTAAPQTGPGNAVPAPQPAVRAAQPTSQGLSQPQIVGVIRGQLGYITARCYQRVLARNPGVRGVVTVSWTVRPDGRAADTRVVHNGTGDDYLARCTQAVVERTRFPAAPNGQSSTARYPFQFGQ